MKMVIEITFPLLKLISIVGPELYDRLFNTFCSRLLFVTRTIFFKKNHRFIIIYPSVFKRLRKVFKGKVNTSGDDNIAVTLSKGKEKYFVNSSYNV